MGCPPFPPPRSVPPGMIPPGAIPPGMLPPWAINVLEGNPPGYMPGHHIIGTTTPIGAVASLRLDPGRYAVTPLAPRAAAATPKTAPIVPLTPPGNLASPAKTQTPASADRYNSDLFRDAERRAEIIRMRGKQQSAAIIASARAEAERYRHADLVPSPASRTAPAAPTSPVYYRQHLPPPGRTYASRADYDADRIIRWAESSAEYEVARAKERAEAMIASARAEAERRFRRRRSFGIFRSKPEPGAEIAMPLSQVVRQQPVRQARSRRSGKR